jgi:pilus assembly protein Flp/PilA
MYVVAIQMLYVRAMESLRSLRENEEGQGLVEYALIISLVSIGLVVALGLLKTDIESVFTKITTAL